VTDPPASRPAPVPDPPPDPPPDPDRLAAITARWANKPETLEISKAWALVDVRWLVAEVERLQRYEAMWQDCRRHRDQAEQRARRLQEIVQQVADLVAPDEGEL
jgi:hypothetical protein